MLYRITQLLIVWQCVVNAHRDAHVQGPLYTFDRALNLVLVVKQLLPGQAKNTYRRLRCWWLVKALQGQTGKQCVQAR